MTDEDLHKKIKQGDPAALDQLMQSYSKTVADIALHYFPKGLSMDLSMGDLIHQGRKGVVRAIQAYDPAKGHKFSSYAIWWIRQHIVQHLAENTR